jgi:choline-sulfatase
MKTPNRNSSARLTRRQVLRGGAAAAGMLLAGCRAGAGPRPAAAPGRPNFLFLITDQQGLDAVSAIGCPDLKTPNIDRLVARGTAFLQSYSANPLCSPARSSLFTGRPTLETGVRENGLPIREGMPNLGQWFGQNGYESVYVGKWHVPIPYAVKIPGFAVLPGGRGTQGTVGDAAVSRACEGYLRNRTAAEPFFLVASLLQPHDICGWHGMYRQPLTELPYTHLEGRLPPLPPNFDFDPREPAALATHRRQWPKEHWRFYLYNYYRMVEMADADIGRILDALDASGAADSTVIVLTADHGEGRGRHQTIAKNFLYDEAAKVPLVFCAPGRAAESARDAAHLVSGVDLAPTLCDLAGLAAPPNVRGRSLRPLLEGKTVAWRDFVHAEVGVRGRMIRTDRYKYVAYQGDPVEQLFDMQADPGETRNLAGDSKYAGPLADHARLLADYESHLDVAPFTKAAPAAPKAKGKQKLG